MPSLAVLGNGAPTLALGTANIKALLVQKIKETEAITIPNSTSVISIKIIHGKALKIFMCIV